ncbi:MAG: hypothetical protein U0X39_10790 [Bacteroidales bacterium]
MNTTKRILPFAAFAFILVILVAVRLLSPGRFRTTPAETESFLTGKSPLITINDLQNQGDKYVLINLDPAGTVITGITENIINIKPGDILKKESMQKISAKGKTVALCSADLAMASRTWMLLKQMGIEKLFILVDSTGSEVLKYKFRPDTLTRPESGI